MNRWVLSRDLKVDSEVHWEGVPEFWSGHAKRPVTHGAEVCSGGGKEVGYSGA